jgi:hypothetical protein
VQDNRKCEVDVKTFGVNVAVVVVTVVLMLLLGEAVLRLFPALIDVSVLDRFHPSLRSEVALRLGLPVSAERKKISAAQRNDGGPDFYIYRPGAKKIYMIDEVDLQAGGVPVLQLDRKGFNNPLEKADRPTADIVMIGDSFTFGSIQGASNTFSARLEKLTGLTTYNLGIGGIGLYEYIELYRLFGASLKPRMVVMNIYEGNDLRDAVRYSNYTSGTGVFKRKKQPAGGLFAGSYVLAFLKSSIELAVKSISRSVEIDFHYDVVSQGRKVAMNIANGDMDEVEHARSIAAGKINYDVFDAALAAFARLAEKDSFIPVVSYLPAAYSAYRHDIRFGDVQVGRDVLRNADAQRAWFKQAAIRHQLHFIDMTEVFVQAVKIGPLTHFPANVHFTGEGHKVAADTLANFILNCECLGENDPF